MELISSNKMFTVIDRGNLPSLERKGASAYMVSNSGIVFIVLHETGIDIESRSGIAVNVSSCLCDIHTGVSDTIFLGSVSGESVGLFDVITVEGASQCGKPWPNRLYIMESIIRTLSQKFREFYAIPVGVRRGLMRLFDKSVTDGGSGIFLHIDGDTLPVFCKERGINV